MTHEIDGPESPRDALVRGLAAHDAGEGAHEARMHLLSRALDGEHRPAMRLVRVASPIALAIAALLTLAFLVPLRETSARARWDDLARAAAGAESRSEAQRWKITLVPPAHHADRPPLTGTLEVVDDAHFGVELFMPDGRAAVFARNGDTITMPDRDRVAEHRIREGERVPAPAWLATREGELLVGSISRLLTQFDSRFAIAEGSRDGDATLAGHPGWRRLDAARLDAKPGAPSAASLWFDADGTIQQIEVVWSDGDVRRAQPPRDRPPPPPGPGQGPGQGPGPGPGQGPGQGPGGMPSGAPARMVLERLR